MANQFLALSMFIMLLSFFIVLNSLSDFEIKKSNPILNSLSLTFAVEKPEESQDATDAIQTSTQMRKGTTLDQLQGLFEAEIVGVEARQNRLGTMMHLRMPYAEFETQINTLVKGAGGQDKPALTQTLVSLLDAAEDGNKTKMQMIANLHSQPAVALANKDSQLAERTRGLSKLAASLERAGLPKKLVTTGLKEGNDEMIDLFFTRYEPFNPLLNTIKEGT